jgi:putative oxidoreductase
MRNILFGDAVGGPIAVHLGLAALRISAGLALAFGHGLGKLPPPSGFIGAVEGLGFPVPWLFAWMAGLSEFLGGILLAAGLMTRPAAATIAFTMAIAAFGQHADDPFKIKELAVLYGAIAVTFACTGSGRFGLDRIIGRG